MVTLALLAAGLWLLVKVRDLGLGGACVGCGGRGAHRNGCPLDRR